MGRGAGYLYNPPLLDLPMLATMIIQCDSNYPLTCQRPLGIYDGHSPEGQRLYREIVNGVLTPRDLHIRDLCTILMLISALHLV
jgi:hypothetical protein